MMTSKEALKHIKNAPSFMGGDDRYNDCLNSNNDSQSLDKIKQILNSQQLYLKDINQIERDLEVLECFKKYFNFELVFENNQTYLVFKSKERYLPVDTKLSISNKYYEPLKEWLEND